MRPRRRLVRWAGVMVGVALVVLAGIDLYGPRRTDIRVFDATQVARLDTDMWRSYYDHRPAALFFQLAELMRGQFHFPLLRSYVAAARSARAAFVFKGGRNRSDYARALPDLIGYYRMIRDVSTIPFDEDRAARLELEWWIVHRERLRHDAGDLDRALADAAAALYGVPASSLAEYARERAVAMVLRDTREQAGGVREQDWQAIAGHLEAAWAALAEAVRPSFPVTPIALGHHHFGGARLALLRRLWHLDEPTGTHVVDVAVDRNPSRHQRMIADSPHIGDEGMIRVPNRQEIDELGLGRSRAPTDVVPPRCVV